MSLISKMQQVDTSTVAPKHKIFNEVVKLAHAHGYTIDDVDLNKPWGFYIRFEASDAERFVPEFFPGLSLEAARLGNPEATLSPKFLLVCPGELLSWQYHKRRAERWAFLTPGAYYKSENDDQGELQHAQLGDVVQFQDGERHRLVGQSGAYVLVAEIWQHTDSMVLSDEADIVRLDDKYKR